MTLLTLPAIQAAMLQQYQLHGVTDLRMGGSTITEAQLTHLSQELGVSLPESFTRLVKTYDFGQLTLGSIFFGSTGSYLDYLRKNHQADVYGGWWGREVSPPCGELMVAGSDSSVLLLNSVTGKIYAFSRGERWETKKQVADSFALLIRAAGTIYLSRRQIEDKASFGQEVGELCGEAPPISFWPGIAQGFL